MEDLIMLFQKEQKVIKNLSYNKARSHLSKLFKDLNRGRKIGNRFITTQSLVDSSKNSATTQVYWGEKGNLIFTFFYKY